MSRLLRQFDVWAIDLLKKISMPLARLALFTVFFWFGFLKIFNVSPANPLVANLLAHTLPGITFYDFNIFLACYEMLVGIAFLIPRFERLAIFLLIPHMFTTVLPLIVLPDITWQGWFIPTLEGQYIIKNIIIVALAFSIASHLTPFRFGYKK
jgi:uncharacterized membrane protein YkgB